MEYLACEHSEKIGPGQFEDCGLPAVGRCTNIVSYNYCKHHMGIAMVAGFRPVPFKKFVIKNNEITPNTPDTCLAVIDSIIDEAKVDQTLRPPHCVECRCHLEELKEGDK